MGQVGEEQAPVQRPLFPARRAYGPVPVHSKTQSAAVDLFCHEVHPAPASIRYNIRKVRFLLNRGVGRMHDLTYRNV